MTYSHSYSNRTKQGYVYMSQFTHINSTLTAHIGSISILILPNVDPYGITFSNTPLADLTVPILLIGQYLFSVLPLAFHNTCQCDLLL